ncbi:ABC transporter substrate-binding protein [Paenibacillus sp. GCM10023248]|uniref:ABC transporter substrate-binding protein n=1 Tax=Bacillales TaxID=1385 RepID=UPI002379F72A|nr:MULTISPECIES: ABC transporter substrate-binding protein [Bacillales]MDD9267071.1 ABC transporter substrate-binding protein [Paenibacillus sp. MAHUQ-63]MDR6881286.1 ABC-type glycerol-3-phosphate transport system substrate-binding protein [Bacillus sp. 3255]
MKRKWLRAITPLTAAALLLSGCTGTDTSSQQMPGGSRTNASNTEMSGTLTVVTNRTDMIDRTYKEYARRFQEKYPAIHIQFEALRDYDKNIKIRLASGETPDVLLIPSIPNSDLGKFFAPLSDVELQGDIYFQDFKDYQGVTYGIPSGVAVSGVIYNKKAFEQAGIGEVPRTLDAFYAVCAKLKQSGIVPFASNFKDRWPLQFWSTDVPMLLTGKAGTKNELADTAAPFQPGNPYDTSMSIIKTLYEQGFLEPNLNDTNWEGSKRELAAGKIGMMLTGNWAIKQMIENGAKPEDIGFFPFPADNSGKLKATRYPDRYYAVGKNSKHQAAAKAFMKWMVEESGYENYSGFIPVLKNRKPELPQLLEMDAYQPEYVEVIKDTDRLSQILNKAQLEMPALVQEYMLGTPAEVLEKYNQQWAGARQSLNISP